MLPVHYEGWRHFREGREAVERAFTRTPEPVRRAVRWLPPGVPVDIEV
ncbi:hypothetical protein JNW88_10970 [Micromonospora sp. ATA32]|nr:hypothetical protein [Micromonospora sp. ATA32]